MGMKNGGGAAGGGDIIQVEGGHIVRSTSRNDRHSKVYTSKGPRDRRVRLSAHTAIEFYDVQDRLGFDRPSKAVDWLMKKAKSSIDKLAEIPPWHPTSGAGKGNIEIAPEESESSGYNFQRQFSDNQNNSSPYIPSPVPATAINDSMKPFFPTSSGSASVNFQSYPINQNENLCLSLQSYQDPDLLLRHQADSGTNHTNSGDHSIFQNSVSMGFDSHFQRMVGWNLENNEDDRVGGFTFNSPAPTPASLLQRGTLQSSFSQSVRSWDDFPISSDSRYVSDSRYASGFCIPARIQGEDDRDIVSDLPSSSSPSS